MAHREGLRCKGTRQGTSPFSQPGQLGGCWQSRFSVTGQITLTRKLFSEPLKNQIWSSSQSKHNSFQQPAAQAGEIQQDSPPIHINQTNMPEIPQEFLSRNLVEFCRAGGYFSLYRKHSVNRLSQPSIHPPMEFPSLKISKNKILVWLSAII